METKRLTIPAAEELLGRYFPVLDHGFIALKDYMGGDEAIDEAARTSYGAGTRQVTERRGLIRTLRRNLHCYTPEMEVLTARGWLRWDDCEATELFMVPDPQTGSLHPEMLELEVFDAQNEELFCFENERMSYSVTHNHRMWFKGKYKETFEVVRVQDMPHWGHFDPLSNYAQYPGELEKDPDPLFAFAGFYLGDGHYASKNRVSFHLRKERKKIYLRDLLTKLAIPYEEAVSKTYEDATIFYIATPDFLRELLGDRLTARAKNKSFPMELLYSIGATQLRGLLHGLMNSDGSEREDRDQNSFYSSSPALRDLFQAVCALLGVDAHHTGEERVTAYFGNRTSLEARKQYFSTRSYTGKVYCTTTSTGLLMVRGGPDKFGFVCGNTSPFEMCELKFHCSMPIFVARQWIRHRTASVNEYSGRYSVIPMLFYTPDDDQIRAQSKRNKQGRGALLETEASAVAAQVLREHRERVAMDYEWMVGEDFARELARIDLPLSTYTQWYWKIDLHNLLHFLGLRCDPHAQFEIRVFADVMAGMVKRVAPLSFEAWIDYFFAGARMSRMEMDILRKLLRVGENDSLMWNSATEDSRVPAEEMLDMGLTRREVVEFAEKLRGGHTVPSFDLDLSETKDGEFFQKQWEDAVPKIDKAAP